MEKNEKAILIKVDEELHKKMKVAATMNDMTLKAYLIWLMEKDAEKQKMA